MERLSVSLDEKSLSIIEEYLSKYNVSKAGIIRKALQCLKNMEELREKIPLENIMTYIDYLANMEHIIVDVAHWKSIFSEIGKGSEKFWDEVYKIGEAHTKEYYDKGLRDVEQILRYIEKTNWYKLNIDSENSYTLILTVSESSKFIKTFFEGFFSKFPRKIEISEGYKKIRIKLI